MNKIIAFSFLLFILYSCKNKDISASTAKSISSKQLQKNMDDAAFTFDFLSAKAKVNFKDEKMNQNFTANIRIENNKRIWLSLTGPFGIEGGRVLIEKNRVQIIDRLNGKYYDESFDYINNFLPFKSDIHFLQTILVGNAFQKELTKQKINLENNAYKVVDGFSGIDANYLINTNYRYEDVALLEANTGREFQMDFEDYRFIEENLFAMLRNINFEDGSKEVEVSLHFTKVKKESELDFPFNVPERMKKQ